MRSVEAMKDELNAITEDGAYPILSPFAGIKKAIKFSSDPTKVRKLEEDRLLQEIGRLAIEGKDFSAQKEKLALLKETKLSDKEISELNYYTDKLAQSVEEKLADDQSEITTLIEPLIVSLLASICKHRGQGALVLAVQVSLPEVFQAIVRTGIMAFFLRQAMQQKGLSLVKYEKVMNEDEKARALQLSEEMTYISLKIMGGEGMEKLPKDTNEPGENN